jgi:hypothetical protein
MTVEYLNLEQIELRLFAAAKSHPECADLKREEIGVTGAIDETDWKPFMSGSGPQSPLATPCGMRVQRVAEELKATVRLRPKRTKEQLADLVREQLGMGFIAIHPDKDMGWRAQLITAPAQAINAQAALEQAVDDLRLLYDLRD